MSEQQSAPFTINLQDSTESYACGSHQSLLVAMEQQAKRAIPVGCRGGGCGVCKIRILQGQYRHKVMSKAHVSEQEKQQGFALACRVYPESDLLISRVEPAPNEVME